MPGGGFLQFLTDQIDTYLPSRDDVHNMTTANRYHTNAGRVAAVCMGSGSKPKDSTAINKPCYPAAPTRPGVPLLAALSET